MADTVLRIGTDEGFVGNYGVPGSSDPTPTVSLGDYRIKRLIETRMAAMGGKTLPFTLSWNDIVFAYRMIYTREATARLPSNLLFAYSPAAKLAYSNAYGRAQETTDTDVTGKTFTLASGQLVDQGRQQAAAGVSTAPLATGFTDNLVWIMLAHGEPAVAAHPILYARRTDASNWLRLTRQSATNVRLEKDVATTITTERDTTIPATEPLSGSAYALRINGTVAQIYVNGTKYDEFTLSAGAQGLTGLQIGFDVGAAGRAVMGELEVWSTLPTF